MKKVITYGTYDLLHHGHIRLLERAKALGDYLVVGVTSDAFDRARGKINVRQSFMERVEALRATGIADEIIAEEYEGQKIDDIRGRGIDIFAIGSDWEGKFDYLKPYCEVVYLERTAGVSSTELRSARRHVVIGVVGQSSVTEKFIAECGYVDGATAKAPAPGQSIEELVGEVDALYIYSHPRDHYRQARYALEHGRHVLLELPMTLSEEETAELFRLADEQGLALMAGCKTAYATAYRRLVLLALGGLIGDVVSVDATCTSLRPVDYSDAASVELQWSSLADWGPIALLPAFQILGTEYSSKQIVSRLVGGYDEFTKVSLVYPSGCASAMAAKGVKSEGELVVSGTKGYIYVPAPWWKTDYFEARFENPQDNRRYFFQLDGEGIRYQILAFLRAIADERRGDASAGGVSRGICLALSRVMRDFIDRTDTVALSTK